MMLIIPSGLGWIHMLCVKQTGNATKYVFTENVGYFGIFVLFFVLALIRQDHLMGYAMRSSYAGGFTYIAIIE